MTATVVALLLIAGCAGGAPAADEPAPEGTAASTPKADPTTAEPAAPETSDYAPCPPGVADTLNAASSGSTTWEEGSWQDVPVGEAIDAPVPSCTMIRGSDWTASFYVGGDQALWDQLAASITALGIPEMPTDVAIPGTKVWGTAESGTVSVTSITPGDTSTILGPAFAEPTVELQVMMDPLP
ncbi:hypothetical protein NQ152_03640 [Microbacterium sp. zg.B48]|uniref:hypothetical protein n=1 Tax=unclassified Microbacterium TaxID=2609290 RepID=UPI00214CBE2A|nr:MULTISPECIES: hypothetical protein [unclassified Microbacterium]MCR2762597.1 hypothetical protein [Microbacterium sp. zg.B48]MCR2810767.1 hypothetical protein [Microbacterium sp. zg.B185]WIM18299.1 hypothetical protein QNO12_11885 [Microbacterium sp. zg-B185]